MILRVMRGGSWGNWPVITQAALRHGDTPADARYDLGFRVIRRKR